jgi:hypothetical protein
VCRNVLQRRWTKVYAQLIATHGRETVTADLFRPGGHTLDGIRGGEYNHGGREGAMRRMIAPDLEAAEGEDSPRTMRCPTVGPDTPSGGVPPNGGALSREDADPTRDNQADADLARQIKVVERVLQDFPDTFRLLAG